MPDIPVTEETSQEERSPLKEEASKNMTLMSVTDETSQDERSPSKAVALPNMLDMSVTRLRSGESVALYTMLRAS